MRESIDFGALPGLFWIAAIAMAGMVIGAFGPWGRVLGFSVSGTDGGNDGWIVVGAGAIAALCLYSYARYEGGGRRTMFFAALCGAASFAVGLYDRNNITDISTDNELADELAANLVEVGWGLNLVLVASGVLTLASLGLTRKRQP